MSKTSVNERYRHRKLRCRTSEKSSQMDSKGYSRRRNIYGPQSHREHESFKRWVRSFRIDRPNDLPEFFTTIFVTGPKIMPVAGKRIRLSLDYFLYLRDECYQVPHYISDKEDFSTINCRVDLVKPLPGQANVPPKQRRVQIVVSYDASQLDLVIANTPDRTYNLGAIGNELTSYVYGGRMQILYDPNGLTSKYQGVVLQSLGTTAYGGRTAAVYTPPLCHIGNNLTYENSNSEKLQIAFVASSGPDLHELESYAEKLKNKESIFVDYHFRRYAYNQNGQIQPDFAGSNQLFTASIKLTRLDFSTVTTDYEEADGSTGQTPHNANKTSCVVSGIIHQISTLGNKRTTEGYKINPAETDEKLFNLFNFIKIQHWQAKSDLSTDYDTIVERGHAIPPYIHWVNECPERAAICHILNPAETTPNANVNRFGAFPYIPIPRETRSSH